jgi:hypothetical protein
MNAEQPQKMDWKAKLIMGFSIFILVNFMVLAVILIGDYSGFNLIHDLGNFYLIFIMIGLPCITFPISIISLVISIFFFANQPKNIKVMGIVTGVIGIIAGIVGWLFVLLMTFMVQ